jgi:hypothetical protein
MTEAIHLFFRNGCQYYVAGRYAAFAGFASTVGNVLHHAIEHFLKGGLSKTRSLPELKQLGHNLPRIWEAFKTQVHDPALAQFDGVITTLHEFEEIRYPDPTNSVPCRAGQLCNRNSYRSIRPPRFRSASRACGPVAAASHSVDRRRRTVLASSSPRRNTQRPSQQGRSEPTPSGPLVLHFAVQTEPFI